MDKLTEVIGVTVRGILNDIKEERAGLLRAMYKEYKPAGTEDEFVKKWVDYQPTTAPISTSSSKSKGNGDDSDSSVDADDESSDVPLKRLIENQRKR
jgi:hypothetical protein